MKDVTITIKKKHVEDLKTTFSGFYNSLPEQLKKHIRLEPLLESAERLVTGLDDLNEDEKGTFVAEALGEAFITGLIQHVETQTLIQDAQTLIRDALRAEERGESREAALPGFMPKENIN